MLKTSTTSTGCNNCTFIERDEEKLSVVLQILKLVLRTHIHGIDKKLQAETTINNDSFLPIAGIAVLFLSDGSDLSIHDNSIVIKRTILVKATHGDLV